MEAMLRNVEVIRGLWTLGIWWEKLETKFDCIETFLSSCPGHAMDKTVLSHLVCWDPSSEGGGVRFVKIEETFPAYDIMFGGRLSFKVRCFWDSIPTLTSDKGSLGYEGKGKEGHWSGQPPEKVCDTTVSFQAMVLSCFSRIPYIGPMKLPPLEDSLLT